MNYEESRLIFSYVTSTIGFVRSLEGTIKGRGQATAQQPLAEDEIPF